MAKLYYRYGAMGSSKTANAIMVQYNYMERGQKALMLKPRLDTRDGERIVGSRCGLKTDCSFVEELDRAKMLGIELVILCEEGGILNLEDVKHWKNPRLYRSPKALTGEKLYKILKSIEERHGCRFLFCTKEEAGRRIIEILSAGKEG